MDDYFCLEAHIQFYSKATIWLSTGAYTGSKTKLHGHVIKLTELSTRSPTTSIITRDYRFTLTNWPLKQIGQHIDLTCRIFSKSPKKAVLNTMHIIVMQPRMGVLSQYTVHNLNRE
jgi:hypothetical protein